MIKIKIEIKGKSQEGIVKSLSQALKSLEETSTVFDYGCTYNSNWYYLREEVKERH